MTSSHEGCRMSDMGPKRSQGFLPSGPTAFQNGQVYAAAATASPTYIAVDGKSVWAGITSATGSLVAALKKEFSNLAAKVFVRIAKIRGGLRSWPR